MEPDQRYDFLKNIRKQPRQTEIMDLETGEVKVEGNSIEPWMLSEVTGISEEVNKIAISADDDKRVIMGDQITTLAYGHYKLNEQ